METDRYRVVIIEDHAPTRTRLARMFENRGWEACTAETVGGALSCLDPAPACLVLDLNLPDGQGETVLHAVRENNVPVKIIAVVTAESDAVRLAHVATLRPNLLIMKPFDWDILMRYCESEITRQ